MSRKRCEHNKIQYYCIECNGKGLCEHNKRKSRCIQCSGSEICIHDKIKSRCCKCDGTSFCVHTKLKTICRQCNETSFCVHNKRKATCRQCNGSAFCTHNKRKSECKQCGGGSICKHNKNKQLCKKCGGSKLCKSTWCLTSINNKKYQGYCLVCFVNMFPDQPNARNYKTKEKNVTDHITETFPEFTWVIDRKIQYGCSRRRPDLLLDLGSHIVIVEVDENKHSNYDCSCENKRLMELSQDLQHRPIVFIRFNPDKYINQEGVTIKSCWKINKLGLMQIMKTKENEWIERINTLKQQIHYWIGTPPEKMVEIIELFY
jgi:hypothetical protein